MAPEDPEIFSYDPEPEEEDWTDLSPSEIVTKLHSVPPEKRQAQIESMTVSEEEKQDIRRIWSETSKAGERLFPKETQPQKSKGQRELSFQERQRQGQRQGAERMDDLTKMHYSDIVKKFKYIPPEDRAEIYREETKGKRLDKETWDAVNFELARITGYDILGNRRESRATQKSAREGGEAAPDYQARMQRLGIRKEASPIAKEYRREEIEEKRPNDVNKTIDQLIKNTSIAGAEKARMTLQQGIRLENEEMETYDKILKNKGNLNLNQKEVKVLETHREQELQQRTAQEGLVHIRGQEILQESRKAHGEVEAPPAPRDLDADILDAKVRLQELEKSAKTARGEKLKTNLVEVLAARADLREHLKQKLAQHTVVEQKGPRNLERAKRRGLAPLTAQETRAAKHVQDLEDQKKREKNVDKIKKVQEKLITASLELGRIRTDKKETVAK